MTDQQKTVEQLQDDYIKFLENECSHLTHITGIHRLNHHKVPDATFKEGEDHRNKIANAKLLSPPADQHSEQAILFARWINKNGWERYDDPDKWICPSENRNVLTTEQLYQKFQEGK